MRLNSPAIIVSLLLAASVAGADQPITHEMIDEGGGPDEYGHQIAAMLADRVGTELAGLEIVDHGFRLNRPTLWYRLTFDTQAFVEEVVARADEETGGRYTLPQLVMAYVLVFEREDGLRIYLGQRCGAELCASQPEGSAIGLGYHFNLVFRHLEPDTLVHREGPREEIELRDRIGSYKHTADSCEDLTLGVRSPEQELAKAVALMDEVIASGMAERSYETVDSAQDAYWRDRTQRLIRRLKSGSSN
jgi:hypothetical protein